MSARVRKAVEQLSKSINDNSAHIDHILRKAGVQPDLAMVLTAAKYYEALNKLASE